MSQKRKHINVGNVETLLSDLSDLTAFTYTISHRSQDHVVIRVSHEISDVIADVLKVFGLETLLYREKRNHDIIILPRRLNSELAFVMITSNVENVDVLRSLLRQILSHVDDEVVKTLINVVVRTTLWRTAYLGDILYHVIPCHDEIVAQLIRKSSGMKITRSLPLLNVDLDVRIGQIVALIRLDLRTSPEVRRALVRLLKLRAENMTLDELRSAPTPSKTILVHLMLRDRGIRRITMLGARGAGKTLSILHALLAIYESGSRDIRPIYVTVRGLSVRALHTLSPLDPVYADLCRYSDLELLRRVRDLVSSDPMTYVLIVDDVHYMLDEVIGGKRTADAYKLFREIIDMSCRLMLVTDEPLLYYAERVENRDLRDVLHELSKMSNDMNTMYVVLDSRLSIVDFYHLLKLFDFRVPDLTSKPLDRRVKVMFHLVYRKVDELIGLVPRRVVALLRVLKRECNTDDVWKALQDLLGRYDVDDVRCIVDHEIEHDECPISEERCEVKEPSLEDYIMSTDLIQIRQVSGIGKVWKRGDAYYLKINMLLPIEPEKLVGQKHHLIVFAMGKAIITGPARIYRVVGPRSNAILIYLPKRLNKVWERLRALEKIKFMLEIESDEKSSK